MNNSKWGKVAARTTGSEMAANGPSGGERRPVTGVGGTMIMKSVSIFLTNGRRASKQGVQSRHRRGGGNMTSDNSQNGANGAAATEAPRRRRRSNVEDSSGKLHPKILEAYKKKTHFSK